MAWFKKKSDPISERARSLSEQIARLEAQIQALSTEHPGIARSTPPPQTPSRRPDNEPSKPSTTSPKPSPPDPLSSTPKESPTPAEETTFEDTSHNPFKGHQPRQPKEKSRRELGIRKSDFSTIWRRFKNNFRGPATSNPQLVKYIAAGSLQGLRPLRYEKRVARNRFILLLICLILVLWGIIAIVMKR